MTRRRPLFSCAACGHQSSQWAGRCPSCQGWGTIEEVPTAFAGGVEGRGPAPSPEPLLGAPEEIDIRAPTGVEGLDRLLGGGVVASSGTLLAGEPGIGKSTM